MIKKVKPIKITLFTLFVSILIINFSCKKLPFKSGPKEGVLIYRINYNVDQNHNPIVIILPHHMVTIFKNDKTSTSIKGFFNTFKLIFLTRPDINKKYILLSINDLNFYNEEPLNGPNLGAKDIGKVNIKFVDSTFMYKGLHCKIAKVYCKSISNDTFNLIYTNDIKIKNPNIATMYSEVPGVIVKTKLKLFNIPMDIELEKIKKQKVDPTAFEIPKKNYKYMSIDALEKMIKSFEE